MITTYNALTPELEARLNQDVEYDITKYGVVYAIINRKTNEWYIGYTTDPMTKRFRGHIKSAKYIDAPYRKLYHAFERDGIENFAWVILEVVPHEDLARREKELIAQYNTCENGYNATHGGEGCITINYSRVKEMFNQGYEVKDIAKELCCDKGTVSIALSKMGINPRNNCTKHRGRDISQYSLGGKYIQTFNTLSDAARYLQETEGLDCTIKSATTKIGDVARGVRKSAYGYYWEYETQTGPMHPVFGHTTSV